MSIETCLSIESVVLDELDDIWYDFLIELLGDNSIIIPRFCEHCKKDFEDFNAILIEIEETIPAQNNKGHFLNASLALSCMECDSVIGEIIISFYGKIKRKNWAVNKNLFKSKNSLNRFCLLNTKMFVDVEEFFARIVRNNIKRFKARYTYKKCPNCGENIEETETIDIIRVPEGTFLIECTSCHATLATLTIDQEIVFYDIEELSEE